MAQTGLIFTRYNNDYTHLLRLPHYHLHEYILVDDGSKDNPRMPDWWKVFKITEDIGWNSEGAKNLAMREMESDWGLTMDLDHPIFCEDIQKLDMLTDILPKEASYNPVRKDGKTINSHLCHKDLWWDEDVLGYDETFSGMYGYDVTLAGAINRKKGSAVLPLPTIRLDIIASGRSMSREQKNKLREPLFNLRDQIEQGKIKPTKERIRFPWERLQ